MNGKSKRYVIPTSILYIFVAILIVAQIVVLGGWKFSWFSRSIEQTKANSANIVFAETKQNLQSASGEVVPVAEDKVVTEKDSIEIQFEGNDTVIIDISVLGLEEELSTYGRLYLDFGYLEDEFSNKSTAGLELVKESDQIYWIDGSLITYSSKESSNTSFVDFEDNYDIIHSENSFKVKATNRDFAEAIRNSNYYELSSRIDNKEPYLTGKLDEKSVADNLNIYEETEIPSEFTSSGKDSELFCPSTAKYRIVEVTISNPTIPNTMWCTNQYGQIFWGINGNKEADGSVKILYLISYDDFGPVDEKAKIVYSSENDMNMMTYCHDSVYMIDAIGVNDMNDEYVISMMPKWCDESDDEYIEHYFNATYAGSVTSISDMGLQYHGRFDTTRYYSVIQKENDMDYGSNLPLLPAQSREGKDLFSLKNFEKVLNFSLGEVIDNVSHNSGQTIRTYSSF